MASAGSGSPSPRPTAFRLATGADVPAVVGLVESAYRGEASRAGWTTEADLLSGRRTDAAAVSSLAAAGALVLAVDGELLDGGLLDGDLPDGGELLGCCHLEPRGAVAYFGMFAVRPDLQSRGTGSALLAEAERRALAGGAVTLEMTVIAQRTDLIAWYERRGYAATGERRPFPYGEEEFGVPRRDDLEFVVLSKPLRP